MTWKVWSQTGLASWTGQFELTGKLFEHVRSAWTTKETLIAAAAGDIKDIEQLLQDFGQDLKDKPSIKMQAHRDADQNRRCGREVGVFARTSSMCKQIMNIRIKYLDADGDCDEGADGCRHVLKNCKKNGSGGQEYSVEKPGKQPLR